VKPFQEKKKVDFYLFCFLDLGFTSVCLGFLSEETYRGERKKEKERKKRGPFQIRRGGAATLAGQPLRWNV